MPLLPLEPFLYPDDLLNTPTFDQEGEGRWWVLHTHPRAEKCLARQFLRRGVPFFLPLYQRQWRNRGRLFRSHVPLFPGYLFLHGDGEARLAALETNMVANIIQVVAQDQLHTDLVRVFRMVSSGEPLAPEERLQPGTWVEITQGALAGLEGKIIRRGKQLRFLIEVQFLQQGVSVEVESWMIQPLQEKRPALATGGARDW